MSRVDFGKFWVNFGVFQVNFEVIWMEFGAKFGGPGCILGDFGWNLELNLWIWG